MLLMSGLMVISLLVLAPLKFTYAQTLAPGALQLNKVLNDGGTGFIGVFTIFADCTLSGSPEIKTYISVRASASASFSGPFGNFPPGYVCTVSEPFLAMPTPPPGYSWGTPVITGSPATIVAGALVPVTVTNTLKKAATATALAFIQQPSATATVGQPFAVQPQVAVQDTNGNTVTSDTSMVTLTSEGITSTTTGVLSCGGTPEPIQQPAVQGIAAFTDCQFTAPGEYIIHAVDGSLTPAVSTSIVVVLDVPLLTQNGITVPYDNKQPPNGSDCGYTIAQCGCDITSAAMVLDYFGVPMAPNGQPTGPVTLNDWLKQNGGYNENDDLVYGKIGTYSEAANGPSGKHVQFLTETSFSMALAENYIQTYEYPVILQVNYVASDGKIHYHWVVAYGVEFDTTLQSDTLRIRDPAFSQTTLSAYGNNAIKMVVFQGTHSDFSSIEVIATAPAQALITDANGNQTGFNPGSGGITLGIPASSYVFEAAFADPTGQFPPPPPGTGINRLILNNPQAGSYQFEVSGPAGVTYSASIYGFDHAGNSAVLNVQGQLPASGAASYQLAFNPTSGATVLALQVPIDIKPGSDPAPINTGSNGVVTVAILSSSTFDATTVNLQTLRFGPGGAQPTDKQPSLQDVDGDGTLDMVVHFDNTQTGITNGSTQACLTGQTASGIAITGCDAIMTVPPSS